MEMNWIKISDRPPDNGMYVVIINVHLELFAGRVNGGWVDTDDGTGIKMNKVMWWMPLPESPVTK